MKKFKTGLVAFALVLGVSGAFVSKIHAAPRADDNRYDWSSTSAAPSHPNSTLTNATITEAKANFGCDGVGPTCATGEDPNQVLDPVTIQV